MQRLADLGYQPTDFDIVINTHLHADHVGWNTRAQDGRWMPTFPNARYVFGKAEFEHWTQGDGPRLFPEEGTSAFSLAICESYDNGVVYLAYRPQPAA